MVSRKFLWAAAMVAVAGLSFTSCEEEEDINELIQKALVTFTSDDFFDENGVATISFALSSAVENDVVVTLAASAQAGEGKVAVSADALSFDGNVTIAAGTTSTNCDVTVDFKKVQSGQQAAITISNITGAEWNSEYPLTILITIPTIIPSQEGANVWGILGSFNGWSSEGEILLTKTADSPETWVAEKAKFGGEFKFRGNQDWGDYDLGSSNPVVLGEELVLQHRGANITIEEGVYDVTLIPGEFKAIITPCENLNSGTLDWNVAYNGCDWVEGYLSEGQLESFTVSDTDTEKFYYPLLVNLAEDEDMAALLSGEGADAYFEELQASTDELIELYMYYYDETREALIPELFYNEINDGPELLFEGLPAGSYQMVILSMDANGYFDKGYVVCPFEKAVDAISTYVWYDNYTVNSEWGGVWAGWYPGYEGKYYFVSCKAPGAAYVTIDTYTDDELVDYHDGKIENLLNYTGSSLADYIASGYTIEELADYGVVTAVGADGAFEDYVSTYGLTGLTNLYIIAFDEQGHILQSYGKSPIEIPEVEEVKIDWVEHPEWSVNYDASVDTGYADYPQALVATACDAQYYVMAVYESGDLAYYGIDEIGKDATEDYAMYINYGYTMEDLIGYEVVFDHVPAFSSWSGLENGLEAYLFALDAYGKPTGDWCMEVITGIEGGGSSELEIALQENWSVNPVGDSYLDGSKVYVNVDVRVPGIKYYLAEENNDEDLEYYYGGSVEGLMESYEETLASYLGSYTMADLAYSESDPMTKIRIYNPDVNTVIYLIEFDENGKATGRYGATKVNVPTPGKEEIKWVERTDWAANYDATADTGDDEYNQALVVTVCDAPYFVTTIFGPGSLEQYGIDAIAEDALYYVSNYGMDLCLQYDIVHTSVPAIEGWKGLENGDEAYVFGIDASGALTGEWHMEALTGIAEIVAAPANIRKNSRPARLLSVQKSSKAVDVCAERHAPVARKASVSAKPEHKAVVLQPKVRKSLNLNRPTMSPKASKASKAPKATKIQKATL